MSDFEADGSEKVPVVKHDYITSLKLEPLGSFGTRSREEPIKEFIEENIKEAEDNRKIVHGEIPHFGIPTFGLSDNLTDLASKGPEIHKKRAKDAKNNINDVDYVFHWGNNAVHRLVSDEDESKIKIYINRPESLLSSPSSLKYYADELDEYLQGLKDKLFDIEREYEEGGKEYWWDYYGLLSPEEAKKNYGEENVRLRSKDEIRKEGRIF